MTRLSLLVKSCSAINCTGLMGIRSCFIYNFLWIPHLMRNPECIVQRFPLRKSFLRRGKSPPPLHRSALPRKTLPRRALQSPAMRCIALPGMEMLFYDSPFDNLKPSKGPFFLRSEVSNSNLFASIIYK